LKRIRDIVKNVSRIFFSGARKDTQGGRKDVKKGGRKGRRRYCYKICKLR
jgi:hypothetical protein